MGFDFGPGGAAVGVQENPIGAGVLAAAARATRYGLSVNLEALGPDVEALAYALNGVDGGVSGRFAELCAETVMVAVIARANYHDEPLNGDQITQFVHALAWFQNSWRHTI
jgi:hypothetical protein